MKIKKRTNDRKKESITPTRIQRQFYWTALDFKCVMRVSFLSFFFADLCRDNPMRICFITIKTCEALSPKIKYWHLSICDRFRFVKLRGCYIWQFQTIAKRFDLNQCKGTLWKPRFRSFANVSSLNS